MKTLATNDKSLRLSDLILGLAAALAKQGIRVISAREGRLDHAFEALYEDCVREASRRSLDLQFLLRRHPATRQSSALKGALVEAARRNIISFDNPEYQDVRIKLLPQEADAILQALPGGKDMYSTLVHKFTNYYEHYIPDARHSQRPAPFDSNTTG